MPYAAIVALKKSGALQGFFNAGEALLADITGCRVRPKGTPHQTVYDAAPKFFLVYANGITPGAKGFEMAPNSSVFDAVDGEAIISIDEAISFAERRKVEASLRKKCETTTGDWGYYAKQLPTSSFTGYAKLANGKLYSAGFYNLVGGSRLAPKSYPNQWPVGATLQEQTRDTAQGKLVGGGATWLLLGGLFLVAKKMGVIKWA